MFKITREIWDHPTTNPYIRFGKTKSGSIDGIQKTYSQCQIACAAIKLWLRKLRFLRRRRKLRRSFRSIVFTNALDVWWSRTGSNRRPPACKAGALPTELRPRKAMVGPGRFELPTSRLSGVRSNQLSYGPPRTAGIIQLSKDRALEPGHEVKLACQRSPALYATTT